MRIGVNCYILQADIGGIKQYFVSLFRELLENDADNSYIFFYFEHNRTELEKLGRNVVEKKGILLNSQREIKDHLHLIDVYFCPFGSLIPRPLPVPTVVTMVDIQEVFFPGFFTFHNLVARFWHYGGSTRMADHVVTISDFSKKTLVDYHRLPPDKISVAHLCADERFYRADQVAKCPEKQLPDQYLFYPANRWIHKNHDVLLRALAWLRDNKSMTIHAVFTGYDQENGYSIEKKAEEYGLSGQVVQLGYVSVGELAYLYTHAECMVFPSLFEGFGIPLVEAMASGCPVLSSKATSLPEVGGDAAVYFEPTSHEELAEAVLSLLENSSLRETQVNLGYKRAAEFSASHMAQIHLEAFSNACRHFSHKRYFALRYGYKYVHMVRTLFYAFFLAIRKIFPGNRIS